MSKIHGDVDEYVQVKLQSISYRNRAHQEITVKLALSYDIYEALNLTPVLGRIRNWNQLGTLAQYHQMPLPFLEKKHIGEFDTDSFESERKIDAPDSDSK